MWTIPLELCFKYRQFCNKKLFKIENNSVYRIALNPFIFPHIVYEANQIVKAQLGNRFVLLAQLKPYGQRIKISENELKRNNFNFALVFNIPKIC